MTWKDLLQPFAEQVYEMSGRLFDMDDAELLKLRNACKRPTTTNCGWATYWVAPLVEAMVLEELRIRKQRVTSEQPVGGEPYDPKVMP